MPHYDHYASRSAPSYEAVRGVLAYPYRNLPPRDLEAILGNANISAEDMENFLQTLGNIGRSVVGALPQVLPTVLPVVGTALGGPLGGAAGAALGGVVGSLLGPGQQQQGPRPAPQPQQQGPRPAPQQPSAPPLLGGAPPAASQLLTTLLRPETLQALISMLMGPAGRSTIPVGNTPVPVGAFTNLLGVLANNAAAEHDALVAASSTAAGQGVPRYLENYAGEVQGDPALPEYRAEVLLNILQEAELERARPARRALSAGYYDEDYGEDYEDAPDSDEQFYDSLDLGELYTHYEFT